MDSVVVADESCEEVTYPINIFIYGTALSLRLANACHIGAARTRARTCTAARGAARPLREAAVSSKRTQYRT